MERDFLFPVDIIPCSALTTILSQLFPPRNLDIMQIKFLATEILLQRWKQEDSRSATNSPDIITNRVGSGDTKHKTCKLHGLSRKAG